MATDNNSCASSTHDESAIEGLRFEMCNAKQYGSPSLKPALRRSMTNPRGKPHSPERVKFAAVLGVVDACSTLGTPSHRVSPELMCSSNHFVARTIKQTESDMARSHMKVAREATHVARASARSPGARSARSSVARYPHSAIAASLFS